MYTRFGLVLMVNHACNLRCSYCYTGAKFPRRMPVAIGRRAIDRALRSLTPGGRLELGFFGGEPAVEAPLILDLIAAARAGAQAAGVALHLSLTSNGTVVTPEAWRLLTLPELDLTVSHDGLPELHDRHRRTAEGRGSSAAVAATLRRLLDAGCDPQVLMVVRPDTAPALAAGMRWLWDLGVRRVVPSLDLWARWTPEEAAGLDAAIARAGQLWRERFPELSVGWFDEKFARLARLPIDESARCGFGAGEIAVAPSGRLYPCERLIGEDAEDNAMRLPGHALVGEDFLDRSAAPERTDDPCGVCRIRDLCSTVCRCSNYVRTGDVRRPDGLLCLLDRAAFREAAQQVQELLEASGRRVTAGLPPPPAEHVERSVSCPTPTA